MDAAFYAREQLKERMLKVINDQQTRGANEQGGYVLRPLDDHELNLVRRFIESFK